MEYDLVGAGIGVGIFTMAIGINILREIIRQYWENKS